MQKREKNSLKDNIKSIKQKFLKRTKDKEILVVSHFDTDGITSAAIMIQALKRLDRKFSVKILKSLEKKFIHELPKHSQNKVILFLDLASGSFEHIKKAGLKDVFIIDHHEITQEIPEGIEIINSWLNNEKISGSGLTYLFCNEINPENKKFAKLAILGMIGDLMEENIETLENFSDELLNEDIKKIRGLMIYPSTRPVNKALEYSSQPYIPGVTGDYHGVIEILREAGIEPSKGKYKSLIEFDEEEMKKLTTSILLRNPKAKNRKMIGDIFLLKFFNKLEDARELSAMVNACSRLGRSDAALSFCMELSNAKKDAEGIHAKYKQHIISGLNFVSKAEKIEGRGFVIINARDKIKDTIVGTIASILSNSPMYDEGTIITTMAYYEDKIKVSARSVGRNGRNVREVLDSAIKDLGGGEVGGHEFAAGCIVHKDKEKEFIDLLKKNLKIEMVKI